jgi:hypothetical protein
MMAPALDKADGDLLSDRANRAFTVKGRLKPGVSLPAASGDAVALANAFAQSFPQTNQGFGAVVRTEMQARLDFQKYDAMLAGLLFALVAVVLLIACANIANLLLGRGRARSRELAVRVAIGASRARLVRTLLAESCLIALAFPGRPTRRDDRRFDCRRTLLFDHRNSHRGGLRISGQRPPEKSARRCGQSILY